MQIISSLFSLPLQSKTQLTHIAGMMGLENDHLPTILILMHSDKNHQWKLKLIGKSETSNRIII